MFSLVPVLRLPCVLGMGHYELNDISDLMFELFS